ncbi:MAG: di-heme enzyme, partial [Gemmatimonadetes bacterium]|nr:di-heme enzyme [Gemmatimonadota bacterium]
MKRLLAASLVLAGCGNGSESGETSPGSAAVVAEGVGYAWDLPPGFPVPRVPAENPMSAEKVELGHYLFYDPRLSGNGTQSCASCHAQALAFSDGRRLGVGSTGDVHPRNSMALVNVAYNASYTWGHPDLERLEDQIPLPMFGTLPVEMGIAGHEEEVLARLAADPRYPGLFEAAFPDAADPIQFNHVVRALASFTRTLISGHSAYDRFASQGDTLALSDAAKRGLDHFLSEDFECHHCHSGFNFSVASVHARSAFDERVFHNTGLYDVGGGAYPPGGQGVFETTFDSTDMGRFRPPTLRNVAVTAPYMHDGSIATLEEVLDTYAAGGRLVRSGPWAGDGRANPHKSGLVPGFPMTPQEKADLLEF